MVWWIYLTQMFNWAVCVWSDPTGSTLGLEQRWVSECSLFPTSIVIEYYFTTSLGPQFFMHDCMSLKLITVYNYSTNIFSPTVTELWRKPSKCLWVLQGISISSHNLQKLAVYSPEHKHNTSEMPSHQQNAILQMKCHTNIETPDTNWNAAPTFKCYKHLNITPTLKCDNTDKPQHCNSTPTTECVTNMKPLNATPTTGHHTNVELQLNTETPCHWQHATLTMKY